MKDLSIIKTQSNNYYLISSTEPYHIFISPVILFFIKSKGKYDNKKYHLPTNLKFKNYEFNSEEIKYYYSKYRFLKESGMLIGRDKPGPEKIAGYIHENTLKWQLSNITQIVFEVTDSCNLKCKYCGYGELYDDYDERKNQFMTFETAKTIIDYLFCFSNSELNHSLKRKVSLGFYGGEPLLNMNLIKRIIEYAETIKLPSINYRFNMTTNV